MALVIMNLPSSASSYHQHHQYACCSSLSGGPSGLPSTRTNTTFSVIRRAAPSQARATMAPVRQTEVLSVCEKDDSRTRMARLHEMTQLALRGAQDATAAMKLTDKIQHAGIGCLFEEDIIPMLERFCNSQHEYDDLFTTSLCFRLLRQNGYEADHNVFEKFINKNGQFKESLTRDVHGMLSLHEASYLGAPGEDILCHRAMEFTETHLKQLLPHLEPQFGKHIIGSLELPRHLRMARVETRRFITSEHNTGRRSDPSDCILELAKLEYNVVQSLHQAELAEASRWWKQLGLVKKLTFGRDRPTECYLWSLGILPEPKYSESRIELTKTIAILLVLDDIFDTYGSLHELVLFTDAVRRWDLNAMDKLPEYMKICYMVLYNTTNEIAYTIMKKTGWNAVTFLKKTWIDMIEGFLVESKWIDGGYTATLEEYLENGVTTAGSYMALVHLYFLMGEGVTEETAKLMIKPYPKFFSYSGRILRLWDDLGTATEEKERGGDLASSIECLMREKKISSESEGRKQVKQLIYGLWKEMNGELVAQKGILPQSLMNACLNMSRTAQVVYQHGDNSNFPSVDDCVKSLLFNPINI